MLRAKVGIDSHKNTHTSLWDMEAWRQCSQSDDKQPRKRSRDLDRERDLDLDLELAVDLLSLLSCLYRIAPTLRI